METSYRILHQLPVYNQMIPGIMNSIWQGATAVYVWSIMYLYLSLKIRIKNMIVACPVRHAQKTIFSICDLLPKS